MKAKSMQYLLLFAVFLTAGAQITYGQSAQIVGTVTDASGAVIPETQITAENEETGIKHEASANAVGQYTIPFLPPGSYRIDVKSDGFRSVVRSSVQVQVAQTATVNFELEVGAVTETIDVTDTAPLLDTGTAAMGGVVTSDQVDNLPMKGRNSMAFMLLVPGVRVTRATTNQAVLESHYQFFSVNGSRPGQNQFMLDGANNTNVGFNSPEFSPDVESVQEFRVQTSSYSAEYANAAGAVINIVTKSGTNELHGSVYEFLRNDALDANDFFSNRAGRKKPIFRSNQFGGTVGGPIMKNKAFFFFDYEALRFTRPRVTTTTVPTALHKAGDFSETLTNKGNLVVVHDPLTTREDPNNPGAFLRTPFSGNVVPSSRINAITGGLTRFYGESTSAGDPFTQRNNFFFNGSTERKFNDFSGRADAQVNDSTTLMGRFSKGFTTIPDPALFSADSPFEPNARFTRQNHINTIAKMTKSFSPEMFGEFSASFTRFFFLRVGAPESTADPTDFGFPASLVANSRAVGVPRLTPQGMVGLGQHIFANDAYDRYELKANLSKISGKHTYKFGGVAGATTFHSRQESRATGTYSFGKSFTQGSNPFQSGPESGFGFATFLLGHPTSGTHNPSELHTSNLQKYFGIYFQDDYKATSRLTLNLGIRYDYMAPRTERHDELANFDFTGTATLPNGTAIRGGGLFPGVGGVSRGHSDPDSLNFGPRFGFAYRLTDATVIRGGYGVFFSNTWGSGRNGNGIPPTGFVCRTPLTGSIDGGLTPFTSISDPFPNGFCERSRNTAGLLTTLGQRFDFIDRDLEIPYAQAWNLDIQRRLPNDWVLEITYSGSRGINLLGTLEWNQLAPQHLALGSRLTSKVANPFFGEITQGPLAAETITLAQSLRPFPQLLGVSSRDASYGASTYHAMFLKLQRRFASGFSLQASYTWSKLIDDVVPSRTGFPGEDFSRGNLQNYYDRRNERSLASFDTPHMFALSYVYELPIGPDKSFLNQGGAIGKIIGGWQINGITHLMSGPPLQITGGNSSGSLAGTQRPNWNGQDPSLSGEITDRLGAYFDTSAFSRNDPFTFGNAPRIMPNLRSPTIVNFDVSLFKNTQITERVRLQFRAEFFNTINRTQFGRPTTSLNSSSFGRISRQVNSPRDIQLGLRLLF